MRPSAAFSGGVVDYEPESGVTYPFLSVSKQLNFVGAKSPYNSDEQTSASIGLGVGLEGGLELVSLDAGKQRDLFVYIGADLSFNGGASVASGGSRPLFSKGGKLNGAGVNLRTAKGTVYDTQTLDEYQYFFFSVTAGGVLQCAEAWTSAEGDRAYTIDGRYHDGCVVTALLEPRRKFGEEPFPHGLQARFCDCPIRIHSGGSA